ncbi:hypothetical protein TK78_30320 [Streptomyces sp. Tue 6075]|uniref:hypothetical protein n=1 Tax=Streptomyces sp. Tue 6075 TaxID=1661694 RepID=UPI00094A28D6|nr:hypothetical protein [Streptomyces sp. Tue 6075]APS22754.1 hypothetical protein TK78_30320 [Streptomyces sp. Tue 6075]
MRAAHLEGRSIAAVTRDHRVSRGAIRTAVADLLSDHTLCAGTRRPRRCQSPTDSSPAADGGHGVPAATAQRKALGKYEDRVSTLTP